MTVTIPLSPDQELKLQERAAARGQDVAGYVRQLIDRELEPAATLTEILAPFRREVKQSGISDVELDALFQDAIHEVRATKKVQPSDGA